MLMFEKFFSSQVFYRLLFTFFFCFTIAIVSTFFLNPFHFHEMGYAKQLTQTTQ